MRTNAILTALLLAATTAGCGGVHLFDADEVPVVEVGRGLRPVLSWTPAEVYQLRVYEGPEDRNGFGALWTLGGGGGYENDLRAPVTYGVPPPGSAYREAPPLEAGKTYTVSVTRKDPKGGGDGFFNTRHRYVGTKTFVAAP